MNCEDVDSVEQVRVVGDARVARGWERTLNARWQCTEDVKKRDTIKVVEVERQIDTGNDAKRDSQEGLILSREKVGYMRATRERTRK
jgi:hypothetical protein